MSGKAPPRGPRALLNPPLPAAPPPSSSTSATAQNSRRDKAPPTGPRSLTNGPQLAQPQASTSKAGGLNGKIGSGRPLLNAHNPLASSPPPKANGPSPPISTAPNGAHTKPAAQKKLDIKWSNQALASTSRDPGPSNRSPVNRTLNLAQPALNGRQTGPGGWSSSFATISQPAIPTAPRNFVPPQPSYDPPPPPPPATEPPPPPPPTEEPPPPPPPTSEPPPPPPPTTEPPPPPPPINDPPPPPPPPTTEPPPPPPPSIEPPPPPPPSDPVPPPPPPYDAPPQPPSFGYPPPPTPGPNAPWQSFDPRQPPQPNQTYYAPPQHAPPHAPPSSLPSHPRSHIPQFPRSSQQFHPPPYPPPSSRPLTPPPRPPSPPKTYSLPPLPPWPPSRDEYPPGKDFKVLYDPVTDKRTESYWGPIMEIVRKAGSGSSDEQRITGKGKGKEILTRFAGETVPGEPEAVVRDPRKSTTGEIKRTPTVRNLRTTMYEVKWEYDDHSTGPAPPTAVLVTNLPTLMPNQKIQQHFSVYGPIVGYDPQIDRLGGALGIVHIRFSTHEEARRCAQKENGKKLSTDGVILANNNNSVGKGSEGIKVVLDGEGKVMRALMKEMEARKRRAVDAQRRKEREEKDMTATNSRATPNSASSRTPMGTTPQSTSAPATNPWRATNPFAQFLHGRTPLPMPPGFTATPQPHASTSTLPALPASLPPRPPTPNASQIPDATASGPLQPMAAPRVRRPPPSLVRARIMSAKSTAPSRPTRHENHRDQHSQSSRPTHHHSNSSSSTPQPTRGRTSFRYVRDEDHYEASPASRKDEERSPSPVSRMPGMSSKMAAQARQREIVVDALRQNGHDYVKLEGVGGQSGGSVREEDVKVFFRDFKVDKILQDHLGWYVCFETSDTARRAAMVLNAGNRTLAHRPVTLSIHPAPTSASSTSFSSSAALTPGLSGPSSKTTWTDEELVEQAGQIITKELKQLLEMDIMEKMVGARMKKLAAKPRKVMVSIARSREGVAEDGTAAFATRNLKGLSFKKQTKRVREEAAVVVNPVEEVPEVEAEASTAVSEVKEEEQVEKQVEAVADRPVKKRKKDVEEEARKRAEEEEAARRAEARRVADEDIESEDDIPAPSALPVSPPVSAPAVVETIVLEEHKRPSVERDEAEEPAKKKLKVEGGVSLPVHKEKKPKKGSRKVKPTIVTEDSVQEVIIPEPLEFTAPAVAQITPASSLSPPSTRPSSPLRTPTSAQKLSPSLDPIKIGLCNDDEDLYYARLALAEDMGIDLPDRHPPAAPESDPDAPPPFRVHTTGSARTEGYYKISHAEKSAYVAQYASRSSATDAIEENQPHQPKQTMTSSRSNRANARRQAQGLEEINQVQRAMALSKGETAAAELTIKFNQLQTRKKHLRFARSPIHDWGLYAMERIARGEMVIEYVGEVIRAQIADKREKAYERQGIGSSYLFRIDEDLVVDATKKGNLGRLINHSCDPNCTAKIITILGEKKIVIYAKQDIELGDEITYDYHFPIEQDKIPCLCGSARCRGYLN